MDDLIEPNDLKEAKEQLVADLFDGVTPNPYRSFLGIMLGGQPAAGKTRLIEKLVDLNVDRNFITINGDEFRTYHPRYHKISEQHGPEAPRLTQPFSNALVEFAKQECLRRRHDMIIEGTMRTFGVIERTVAELRQYNYEVEAHVLAIPAEDSLLGIFRRYEGELQLTGFGRFSAIAVHDEAYRQIPHNVLLAHQQHLFDRIMLYSRDELGDLLKKATIMPIDLSIITTNKNPFSNNILALFEQFRRQIQPNSVYHQRWLEIAKLARQRGETNADYLGQIDGFIRQFAA